MKVLVLQKQVPDVVEELVLTPDGCDLAEEEVPYLPNEMDQHALEQALLLKERHGGQVDVLAIGGEEAIDALAEAVAKGADRALYLPVRSWDRRDNRRLSAALVRPVRERAYDLILSGLQAIDDVNGTLGGFLATRLGLPYIGGISAVTLHPERGVARMMKEFPGGVFGALETSLPAVLGIQSAERPLRYVPVSRSLQVKRTLKYDVLPFDPGEERGIWVSALTKPIGRARAEMLQGDADAIAARIVSLVKERGLL